MERMERPMPKQRDEDGNKGFSKLDYNNATCSRYAKRNSEDILSYHVLLM